LLFVGSLTMHDFLLQSNETLLKCSKSSIELAVLSATHFLAKNLNKNNGLVVNMALYICVISRFFWLFWRKKTYLVLCG